MKPSPLLDLIKKLNAFSAENYWDLGKFIVEKVMLIARKEGMFEDDVLKEIASQPGIKFPYAMLKQCQQFYTYYPNVRKLSLPEVFYFDLATKVESDARRKEYEKLALKYHWTISELRKRIHDDEVARREDERTKYGFDLKERNIWSVDIPDPRFGKSNYKGRLPGQIVTNALYYYTEPGWYIVDPFAGSGTLGDVIDGLPHFRDRKYKMYDIDPVDPRIIRNDALRMGIPEQSESVDYIFLDPPSEFFSRGSGSSVSEDISVLKADFILKFKGLIRECHRILKKAGRVSVIVEPCFSGTDFVDFPFELVLLFKENNFKQIGKVYLPRRSAATQKTGGMTLRGKKFLASDCRELLTFEKLH